MKHREREEALETLKGMTKDEIIGWLSNEVAFLFRPPRKSQLLFGRYQAAANAAMERRKRNVLEDGVAIKIDFLSAELNGAKDHKEFLAIVKKMEPYRKKWDKWIAETQAINADEAKVEAMWDAYMAQSDAETAKLEAQP